MRKIKVITDSCSDLNSELLEKHNVDYAKMSTVLEGVESPALLTWSYEDVHKLYDTIRSGKRVTTAQVSTKEFNDIFEKYLSQGFDVIYIGCSSKQSGSVNTGNMIAKNILEKYPDGRIACIDSLNASIGEGMLAIEASKMVENHSFDEIVNHILNIRKKVNQFVTVHTLEHLRKAGRVSASSAFFGNLMGVKPVLISDINGTQYAYKKVKGRHTSLNTIISLLKENIIDSENQTIYVAHADCPQAEIDEFISTVKSEIPCKDVCTVYIGPIIGASIGPDAIGIWGFGNDVTAEYKD